MNCIQCNRETNNPKFCSRSCSAKLTNKLHPRRKPEGVCIVCHKNIRSHLKYCNTCKTSRPITLDITVGEAELRYPKQPRGSCYNLIRTRARKIAETMNWSSCIVCGYNRHIEIAHRKPISSFSKDSKISEINHISNLLPLCPNHHREFDNGTLFIE